MYINITKHKYLIITITAIVVVSGLFIFVKEKDSSNHIKLGVITTLTGESAKYGESALNGITMAVQEINSKGGINGTPINLIIEDDGSQSANAVSSFQKLVNIDKVPLIIGPISSSAAMACSPIANQSEVVLFSPAAATPAFTSPNDFTFRNRVSSEFEIAELARFAYAKLNLNRTAILYVNNDWGLGSKTTFANIFKKIGGNIVAEQAFDEGTTDVRTQLTKIMQVDPDNIFLVGQGSEGGYVLRQAFELGIRKQFLSVLSIQRADIIQIAGDAANGVIYTAPSYDLELSEAILNFDSKYSQEFGQSSDLFSANGYDAMYIVAEAIEQAGYSAPAIKKYLLELNNFPGVSGTTSFDINGDVTKPITIKTIRNGKFVNFDFE